MVSIVSLWLPILLSAVFVFVLSTVMHMVLPLHRNDMGKVPAEDEVMEALRKFNIPPGDYMIPCAGSPEAMRQPAFIEKMKRGPVMWFTLVKSGPPTMGPFLVQWFIYLLVVGVFVAYITGRAVGPGTPYLQVFRFAGATSFIAYTLALWQDSIWYRRKWSTTIKYAVDGLVFALFTAGTFGWLWPK